MIERKLLLGDEAIALGAIHAGISGVYAYPGTPSTEITEFIQGHAPEVRSRWCTNEKTAMEAALGMAYAGKRALVCMKHVGMNVAADAFVNSAITGVNGGLVVLAADDPSMHSSQNEQDSRFYGKFAMIPILEPSTQQEAYDMMAYAYQLSEETKLPVLMRVVTRLAHSRAGVVVREPLAQNGLNPETDRTHWVLLPANARRQYASLVGKQGDLLASSEASPYNKSDIKTWSHRLWYRLQLCDGKPSARVGHPRVEGIAISVARKCHQGVGFSMRCFAHSRRWSTIGGRASEVLPGCRLSVEGSLDGRFAPYG